MASGGTVPSNQSSSQVPQWLPISKLGNGSLIPYALNGQNYFELFLPMGGFGASPLMPAGGYYYAAVITPVNAVTIDTKMDDGLPLTGKVQAVSSNGANDYGHAPVVAEHCITATSAYDTGSANGNGINCDLSFAF
jgi:hypothetical protein